MPTKNAERERQNQLARSRIETRTLGLNGMKTSNWNKKQENDSLTGALSGKKRNGKWKIKALKTEAPKARKTSSKSSGHSTRARRKWRESRSDLELEPTSSGAHWRSRAGIACERGSRKQNRRRPVTEEKSKRARWWVRGTKPKSKID
jgi:hypothetical protein